VFFQGARVLPDTKHFVFPLPAPPELSRTLTAVFAPTALFFRPGRKVLSIQEAPTKKPFFYGRPAVFSAPLPVGVLFFASHFSKPAFFPCYRIPPRFSPVNSSLLGLLFIRGWGPFLKRSSLLRLITPLFLCGLNPLTGSDPTFFLCLIVPRKRASFSPAFLLPWPPAFCVEISLRFVQQAFLFFYPGGRKAFPVARSPTPRRPPDPGVCGRVSLFSRANCSTCSLPLQGFSTSTARGGLSSWGAMAFAAGKMPVRYGLPSR